MIHDTNKLANELNTSVEILSPEIDSMKLSLQTDVILSNYTINKKTVTEVEEDIQEKIELFLSSMKLEGFSERTQDDYQMELRLFSRKCSKPVSQINTIDIRNYLSSNNNITTSTMSKKLSVIKSFFNWLVVEEIVLRNPTLKIKFPKIPKRLPKALSIGELELVRESCATLRQRAIVEVLYSTGARVTELSNFNISDIDEQNLVARVIGKGDKEGIVHFSVRAMYHLKKYLDSRKENDNHQALFITTRKPYNRMSRRSIQNEIKKIKELSNLDKDLTPHILRHTLATLLINNYADLSVVQRILRHENPSTTLIYAHVSNEKNQQAFKKYHVQ